VSIVADALTTPYQAVRRAGVEPGDLAVVVGAGGVGGYCVQVARAFGAQVVAIDVDPRKLQAALSDGGAALTLNARELDAKALKKAVADFRARRRPAQHRVEDLRVLRHGRRADQRLQPAGAWRHVVGGGLHDGQGRSAAVQPDGLRRARLGNWGCPPEYYPAALDLVLDGRVRLAPFVETHPLDRINEVFRAVHAREITRRAVMVP
jgi:6-hydroxycyclohex-1-ene-1-carbonyl-CoA dehydrogenase